MPDPYRTEEPPDPHVLLSAQLAKVFKDLTHKHPHGAFLRVDADEMLRTKLTFAALTSVLVPLLREVHEKLSAIYASPKPSSGDSSLCTE